MTGMTPDSAADLDAASEILESCGYDPIGLDELVMHARVQLADSGGEPGPPHAALPFDERGIFLAGILAGLRHAGGRPAAVTTREAPS
jgi:hypothetical protein